LSGGAAELANVSIVHPRDPSSNIGTDRKYCHFMFVPHLKSKL
jgi:hypothetical protein